MQTEISELLENLAGEEYCYLTTVGRVTGNPHEIEIWFGVLNGKLYLLSGGGEGSDWVKNLRKEPSLKVRIAGHNFAARAQPLSAGVDEAAIRKLLDGKYQDWQPGRRLSNWARKALPVEIELTQSV